jgi:hypothetical protein
MSNTSMADENSPNQQASVGAPVFVASGERIGTVSKKGIQGNLLFVQKGRLFPEVFSVPRNAIAQQDAQGVVLNLSKEELGIR